MQADSNKYDRSLYMRYLSILGWGAAVGTTAFENFLKNQFADRFKQAWAILEVAGLKRIHDTPAAIYTEFCILGFGAANARYQLFWDVGKNQKLQTELDRLSSVDIRHDVNSKFRTKMVPTLARLHALTELGQIEQQLLYEDALAQFSAQIIDPSIPHENFGDGRIAAIEMFWMNATAALIRDEYTWQSARFDVVADSAVRFLKSYQHENFPELLVPAISALQFLLGYAVASRSAKNVSKIELLSEIENIRSTAHTHRDFWFTTVFEAYSAVSGYSSVLPQFGELVIGNKLFGEGISNLVILARLEGVYQRQLASQSNSPFVGNNDRPAGSTQTIFLNYGITRDQVQRATELAIYSDPKRGPGAGFRAVASEFPNPPTQPRGSFLSEIEEKPAAPLVQSLVPFRNLSDRQLIRSHKKYLNLDDTNLDQLLQSAGGSKPDKSRLEAIWKHLAVSRVEDLEKANSEVLGKNGADPAVIAKGIALSSEELLESPDLESFTRQLADAKPPKHYRAGSLVGPAPSRTHAPKGTTMIGIQDAATADPPSGKFVPTKEYESHLEKQGKSWLKKLRLTKDPALRGRVVAIEPDHGRYVVADTFADAIEKFRENFGPNAPHAYYTRLNK